MTCSKIEVGPGRKCLDPYGLLRSAANPGSVGYGRSDALCFRPATLRYQSRFRFPSERRALAAPFICILHEDTDCSIAFVLAASIAKVGPADCEPVCLLRCHITGRRRYLPAVNPLAQTHRYANCELWKAPIGDRLRTRRRNPPSIHSKDFLPTNRICAAKDFCWRPETIPPAQPDVRVPPAIASTADRSVIHDRVTQCRTGLCGLGIIIAKS